MNEQHAATTERFEFLISYKGKVLQPVLDTITALGSDPHCTIDELVDFAISLEAKKYPWSKSEIVVETLVAAIVHKANGKYETLSRATSKVFRSLLTRRRTDVV